MSSENRVDLAIDVKSAVAIPGTGIARKGKPETETAVLRFRLPVRTSVQSLVPTCVADQIARRIAERDIRANVKAAKANSPARHVDPISDGPPEHDAEMATVSVANGDGDNGATSTRLSTPPPVDEEPTAELYSFALWYTTTAVEQLWETLAKTFRGYVLPPLAAKPISQFSEARQRLWQIHYALRSVAKADSPMVLTDSFVHLFAKDVDGTSDGKLPPMSGRATPPPSGAGLDATDGNASFGSDAPDSPKTERVKTGGVAAFQRSNYEVMFRTSQALQPLIHKTFKIRSQPDPTPRDEFVQFLSKHEKLWHKIAQESNHLGVQVAKFTQEHYKRCCGVPVDPSHISREIGRLRVSERNVHIGDRVENVRGDQGTVICVLKDREQAAIGVCWDAPGVGFCDGMFEGVRHFVAGPNQASFVSAQNLFTPRDHDDVIQSLLSAIMAVDGILHPPEEVRGAIIDSACQLTSALQFYSSFYQAHANCASELITLHHTLQAAELWAKTEQAKKSPDGPRMTEVKKLAEALSGEWWLASRAFSDSVEAFKPSFAGTRLDIAMLFDNLSRSVDVASWGEWSTMASVVAEVLDPSTAEAVQRVFDVSRVA